MCGHASIYDLRVGVTGYKVSFKQGEFSLTLIYFCSVFTAERENVGYPQRSCQVKNSKTCLLFLVFNNLHYHLGGYFFKS